MSEIIWEEPPPPKRNYRGSKWTGKLAPLINHPGRWARIETYKNRVTATSQLGNLRRNAHWLPAPIAEWEFVAREVEEEKGALYVRYLGPEVEDNKEKAGAP